MAIVDGELPIDRRKENSFANNCLIKIKEHLSELTETVIRIQERQDYVLKYIAENKVAIQAIEKDLQAYIGKCPYEREIKEIHDQCTICRGQKKTWSSLPMLIQLIISIITVLFILYKK